MNFELDAFISYAHQDNLSMLTGATGWVSKLHQDLEKRLTVNLYKKPQIWRDRELEGNDNFSERLLDHLRSVASLVLVVSRPYLRSDWTRKELLEFWKAAEKQGGVQVGAKSRIFKVLKSKIEPEKQWPELKLVLGYDFFKEDPETKKVIEFDETIYGPSVRFDYWARLEDLAQGISELIEELEGWRELPQSSPDSINVYLAETTSDLKDQRDAIRRDLVEHHHTVFPSGQLPWVASELATVVSEDLAKCQMSIHLIGKRYGSIPEGETHSLLEIQNELAIMRGEKGDFSRLIWIPAGLQVEDDRQLKVLESLRMDPRVEKGSDLLETALEDLKTVIQDRLKQRKEKEAKSIPPSPLPAQGPTFRIYMVYDQKDANLASPWADYLFDQGFEVIHSVFEGDEADRREYEQESLCACDGVVILFGAANILWLNKKRKEVLKSPGYGRTKPMPVVAIVLTSPETQEKKTFKTHEAIVIPQWNGFSADSLNQFISRLSA